MPARRLARTLRADSPRPRARVEPHAASARTAAGHTRPSRERPRPGDEPVDEERLRARRRSSRSRPSGTPRQARGVRRVVGGAGRCPSAAGSGSATGTVAVGERRAREVGDRRARPSSTKRRSSELLEPRLRRRRAAIPSTARGRLGSPGRTPRGSAAPDASPRSPRRPRRPRASSVRARTSRPPCASARRSTTARPRAPRVPRARTRQPRAAVLEPRASVGRGSSSSSGRERGCSLASSAIRSPSSAKSVLHAERGELSLQLRDATLPVQPRVREVVAAHSRGGASRA